jgi:hypothetical protein
MSPNTLLVLLVLGSALTITAILLWAPRYQPPCNACGKRSRLGERTCRCGASLVPKRPPPTPDERAKIGALVGDKNVDELFRWLDAAGVHQPLTSIAWFALGTAYQAVLKGRADVLRSVVNEIDELPRDLRAALIQSGEGSIVIREGLAKLR